MAASTSAAAAAAPPSSCEIARIPEDLLAASISRTAPRDACRAAAVSPAFRAAADSDAVWACFLPGDLPPLADGELSPAPPSKKALFMRLSDRNSPVLLADRLISMWLDRETGAKCYMLSARALCIIWGDTPRYWRWISRFSECAELLDVCWLEIRGKIHCKMLSRNSTYSVYMVFKISDESYGLDYPPQEAAVTIGESKITRQVCLLGPEDEGEGTEEVPQNYRSLMVPAKDGNGSVLVRISAGFGSSGFGFGGTFSPTVFGFGAPKPIGFGFGFGFPPVDIQWISETNHLELKFIF